MRRVLNLSLLIMVLFIFSGCNNVVLWRTEIDKIEYIDAIGIDKSPNREGYVRFTVATQMKKGGGTNGQSMEREAKPICSEGRTAFEAIRDLFNFLEKRPFFGQVNYVLISEDIAKEGFLKHIDWLCRDTEIPLNTKFFIVKGVSSRELMERGGSREAFIAERIRDITNTYGGQSIWKPVDLVEVMYVEDLPYLSLHAPYIELISSPQESRDDSGDEATGIRMAGVAIFNGDKLVDYLDEKQSRGLSWLRQEIGSAVIVVKSPAGVNVSLEIIDNKVKIQPKIIEGQLNINIGVNASSNVAEIQGAEDIFNNESLEFLTKQQEQVIKEEIEGAIRYAQEQELDFIGMARLVFHKYPIAWEDKYQDDWPKVFSKTKINIDVKSKINRTYNINEPTRGGMKKTK